MKQTKASEICVGDYIDTHVGPEIVEKIEKWMGLVIITFKDGRRIVANPDRQLPIWTKI